MFRLLIECTKDIDKLSIDFTDGTSVIHSRDSPDTLDSKDTGHTVESGNSNSTGTSTGDLRKPNKHVNSKNSVSSTRKAKHSRAQSSEITDRVDDSEYADSAYTRDAPVRPGQNAFLDTDADFSHVKHEVIPRPTIETGDRPVKVAEELQNMDF